MASSLAVEWAKKGVRGELLHSSLNVKLNLPVNVLSPGYMLTKLTRTILANDPELKVRSRMHVPARPTHLRLAENMGDSDSDGEGTVLTCRIAFG